MPVFESTQTARHLMRTDAQRKRICPEKSFGDIGSETYTIRPAVRGLGHTGKVPGVSPKTIKREGIFDIVRLRRALPSSVDGPQMLYLHAFSPIEPSVHNIVSMKLQKL